MQSEHAIDLVSWPQLESVCEGFVRAMRSFSQNKNTAAVRTQGSSGINDDNTGSVNSLSLSSSPSDLAQSNAIHMNRSVETADI